MERSIVVPFDGSAEASAALRRALSAAAQERGLYSTVLIATVGLEPAALEAQMAEARRIAGPELPVELRRLDPTDPYGSFCRLLLRAPDATLAAPVGARGRAPWYAQACRASDIAPRTMLFFLTPRELKVRAVSAPSDRRLLRPLHALHGLLTRLARRRPAPDAAPAVEVGPLAQARVRRHGEASHRRRPGGCVPDR